MVCPHASALEVGQGVSDALGGGGGERAAAASAGGGRGHAAALAHSPPMPLLRMLRGEQNEHKALAFRWSGHRREPASARERNCSRHFFRSMIR